MVFGYSLPFHWVFVSIVVACISLWSFERVSPNETIIDLDKVVSHAKAITSRSWEIGALSEALIELHNPELSVFGANPFPGGTIPLLSDVTNIPGLDFVKSLIWTNNTDCLINGEGSPADPASLGVSALLLSGIDKKFLRAAERQANYLINFATKLVINSTHSAISHRDEPPELWGDFVYMVPPFLAYYGVAKNDQYYLEETLRQLSNYNLVLQTNVSIDGNGGCIGLWKHIVSQPYSLDYDICCSDTGTWLTSNAWAVAGMTRVLATIMRWQPPDSRAGAADAYSQFQSKALKEIDRIIQSILFCTMKQARDPETGLIRNYLDGSQHPSAEYAFGDVAGTALMSSAVYRLAVLQPSIFGGSSHLSWANQNRKAVLKFVDCNGKVSQVADIHHVPSMIVANETSEAQSMVILMYSAWRDCKAADICETSPLWWQYLFTSFR